MSIQKTPGANNIFFVWLNNYSGVLIKTPSKTLVIDPVDVKAKNFHTLDAILITHEAYDHLDQQLVAEMQKATGCTVIADAASAKKLQYAVPADKLQTTKSGMETKLGEVTVKTENCNNPQAKAPVTYIISSEDNVKVYHTADSLPFNELGLMAQKEQFDLVFCTVGITPGASPQTGFEVAWLTKPPLAVPYHTASVQNQKDFADLLRRKMPKTASLIPQQNKIYQVSKRQT